MAAERPAARRAFLFAACRRGRQDSARSNNPVTRMLRFARLAALALPLLLIACGPPSTEDALKKAEKAGTKAELEKALGSPTEIQKLGPLEQWTYKTSDGSVTFVIAADKVTLASGGTTKKK